VRGVGVCGWRVQITLELRKLLGRHLLSKWRNLLSGLRSGNLSGRDGLFHLH